jgi:hypothetical protein
MKTKIIVAILAVLIAFFLIDWLPKIINESGFLDYFWREIFDCFRKFIHLP